MNLCYGSRAIFYCNLFIYSFSALGIFPCARSPAINGRKQNGTVCDFFGAGGALGFDTVAAQTVIRLKVKYPKIRLILVLPCTDQAKFWNEDDSREYERIKKLADKTVYTSEKYYNGCMAKKQTPCR